MKLFFFILSMFCFLYALFVRAFAGFLKRIIIPWTGLALVLFALSMLWEHIPPWAKTVLLLLMLAGAAVYAYYGYKLIRVIRDSKKDHPVDYLIVLGAQVYGRRPCDALKMRLEGALVRHAMHPKAKIIVSGGKGSNEDYAEAEVMREYLLARGVDSPVILVEDRSANTAENLKFSAALMDRTDAPAGIASNSYHLFRAMELAAKVGLKKAVPVYAKSGDVTFLHHFTREIVAVCMNDVKKALGIKNGKV